MGACGVLHVALGAQGVGVRVLVCGYASLALPGVGGSLGSSLVCVGLGVHSNVAIRPNTLSALRDTL